MNIALTVGDIGQTVEVTANAPLLQTESTQVGSAINSKTLTDVPLGGQRNFAYLARLVPGVVEQSYLNAVENAGRVEDSDRHALLNIEDVVVYSSTGGKVSASRVPVKIEDVDV